MELAPHINNKEKINKIILLHHSWSFIQEKIKPRLEETEELTNEDYPMLNGKYKDINLTAVATGMGTEESLNIVDQLINLGANIFLKIGTFVALDDKISIGEIFVPHEAEKLPGVIDSILRKDERAVADEFLLNIINETAYENQIKISTGDKILTCPLYGPYIRDEVIDERFSIDYWKNKCFGDEMECSVIFAITNVRKVKSAAILVCNRTWKVLDDNRRKIDIDWNEHKNSKKEEYKNGYENAVELALESLYKIRKLG